MTNWSASSERTKKLTRGANPSSGVGLEIGALHNPTIPQGVHDVRFVDYADTATLKNRHAEHPERVDGMVTVDYVWQGSGSLANIIGASDVFDFVIASHVLEHVPNILGWFRGIAEVMKVDGVFNLALPDKRFTFDIACPHSTVGQLVEADLLGYVRPSIRQMFDHCYYAKAIEPGAIWTTRIDVASTLPFSGAMAPDLALAQAKTIVSESTYFDSHCWIFTPLSFIDLLEGAIRLSLFPLVPEDLTPTAPGSFEFYVSLRKPRAMSADELLSTQIAALNVIKQSCSEQQRWSALLAN
jgi:SAM-dependent methyltransferase